jgi:hypothetical protein
MSAPFRSSIDTTKASRFRRPDGLPSSSDAGSMDRYGFSSSLRMVSVAVRIAEERSPETGVTSTTTVSSASRTRSPITFTKKVLDTEPAGMVTVVAGTATKSVPAVAVPPVVVLHENTTGNPEGRSSVTTNGKGLVPVLPSVRAVSARVWINGARSASRIPAGVRATLRALS